MFFCGAAHGLVAVEALADGVAGADWAAAELVAGAAVDDGLPDVAGAALPPNFFAAAGKDMVGREWAVEGWVPLARYVGVEGGEVVEAWEHFFICAIWTTAVALGTAGNDSLILVAFVADPPDFLVAGGSDVVWGEGAVFGWVPLAGDVWILAGEIVFAGDDLFACADWATAAAAAAGDGCLIGVAFGTDPPDFAPTAGDNVGWSEGAVFGWMPLSGEIWIGCGEVVHAGQRQASAAIWAACATAGAGVDCGLPVVTVGTGPPDFAFAAVADAVGSEWRVARAVPFGEKILALVAMAIF